MSWGIRKWGNGGAFTVGYEPPYNRAGGRKFVAYWAFIGWDCISLGAHVCTSQPNIEVHLPFSFIRIGWVNEPCAEDVPYWVAV